MGGSQTGSTSQHPNLSPELQGLTRESSERVLDLQRNAPLRPYLEAHPQAVAPLTGLQQRGLSEIPGLFDLAKERVTGANIQQSPSYQAANTAFQRAILPTIENQA